MEHGCFSPPVFAVSGGMGPSAKVFYKKLASMITLKHGIAYNRTLNWLRRRLSFSLFRSAVMCLRGSQSSRGRPALPAVGDVDIELALSEGHMSYYLLLSPLLFLHISLALPSIHIALCTFLVLFTAH